MDHQSHLFRNLVEKSLEEYFKLLDGSVPAGLYDFALREMEVPLFKYVLKMTNHNQTAAAKILGISRCTFRKKLRALKDFLK